MKKILTLLALCAAISTQAQTTANQVETEAEGYKFTDTKTIATPAVKDQSRSGTCWCYSTLSFIESEILKAGGEPISLSEMWIVRHTFMAKAEKFVRLHGSLNFAEGGAAHDVTEGIKAWGIVPLEVYKGFNYGTEKADFNELTKVLTAYINAVVKAGEGSGKNLTTAWKRGFNAILDEYFGVCPEKFTYKGKEYTPASFAASLPVKMDDFISITSFTHHPFGQQIILELPDNWMWAHYHNMPLDDMMAVVDNAMAQGYTVAWGTDVSEKGFNRTKAIGIIPEQNAEGLESTEAERWGKLSAAERDAALYKFDKPGRERVITQQMRQEAFDNYQTTDDHGMVIMGTATDQAGNPYFKVLNSWDVRPPFDGFFYFSRPFVAYKTTSIMVNRKALPVEIAKKLQK